MTTPPQVTEGDRECALAIDWQEDPGYKTEQIIAAYRLKIIADKEAEIERLNEDHNTIKVGYELSLNEANHQLTTMRTALDAAEKALESWYVKDDDGYYPDDGHAYTPTRLPHVNEALTLIQAARSTP